MRARSLLIAGAATLSALVACEDVLGIDGQFSSVPQAFCTTASNTCPGIGLVETQCEEGISGTPATGSQFLTCSQPDAGCQAFVTCLDHAAGGCTSSNDTTLGLPCVVANGVDPCCSPRVCTVPDGGVGLCQ